MKGDRGWAMGTQVVPVGGVTPKPVAVVTANTVVETVSTVKENFDAPEDKALDSFGFEVYWCDKCQKNHRFNSNIGKEHSK